MEPDHSHLHIFVNRRKFEESDGVKPVMTGGDIASLVKIPPNNAVVRGPDGVEIGINQPVHVKNGAHFTATRQVVEGGHGPLDRVERELNLLREGGQVVECIRGDRQVVLYRDVPTAGAPLGLPRTTDVVVPVPSGYPGSPIDLAGLPVGSPLLARTRGGQNNQGLVNADGRRWQLASYHPHNGGGGPPWDQTVHGFHTYLDHLLAWLHRLT